MNKILNATLGRLRGGNIDDGWWRRTLDFFGQRYVSPGFLRKPAIQEWLADQQVADDFKVLAAQRIVLNSEGSDDVVARLVEYYSTFTGEAGRFATVPIDVVIAVLVAGYIASIPPDQRPIAGIVQRGFENMEDRFDHLEERLRPGTVDPILQDAHTQSAVQELNSILRLRTFDPAKTRAHIRTLLSSTHEGNLTSTHSDVKTKIVYWAARLCATDPSTIDLARQLRNDLVDSVPAPDLAIVDALVAVTTGERDEALRLIRDQDSSAARTVVFGVLMTTKGEQAALAWADHLSSLDDRVLFSGPGWVNWAICAAKQGMWRRAAERLRGLQTLWDDCPMLAFIEGTISAALLLSDEFRYTTLSGVPLFPGVRTRHGSQALGFHDRATQCFEFVEETVSGADLDVGKVVRDWRLWLRVADPTESNSNLARSEIADRIKDGREAVKLVLFATTFCIPYDARSLTEYLERRKEMGGLDDDEILAELLLLQGSIGARELVAHIATHRGRLKEVVHPGYLADVEVEALARDGQLHRARTLIGDRSADLGEEHVARLNLYLETMEGDDPRSRLEELYRRTKSIVDLRSLVAHLRSIGDVAAVRPRIEELFRRERTVDNLLDVVRSLSDRTDFDFGEMIRLLEGNRDLMSRNDDLKAAYGLALFHGGMIQEAKGVNDDLVRRRSDPYDSCVDINIAIVTGEWDRVAAVIDREWLRRHSHDGPTLMHFASLASWGARVPDRALALARLATQKAPDDPRILAGAFWLHCKLGREREADQGWLTRGADLSSASEGPLWRIEAIDAVERLFPRRHDLVKEVERRWLGGEIPLSVAATTFNVSLARMIWHIPKNNLVSLDGRTRTSVPIVSGERGPVEIQSTWTIGLDVTSVMVLEYLGLLQQTVDAFDRIRLSPDVMELLFCERDNVRFHQPSLVDAAKELVTLYHTGRLAVVEDQVDPPEELIDEVGLEMASLLYLAEQECGVVVCELPLRRAGSLTELADIGSLDRFVLSTADFCGLVHKAGRMDFDDYQRALQILNRTKQWNPRKQKLSILEGPIYITDVALSYLQDAKLLPTLVATLPYVRIHENVATRAQALIEESDHSDDTQAWIDRIGVRVASAISNGEIALLPRVRNQEEAPALRGPRVAIRNSVAHEYGFV